MNHQYESPVYGDIKRPIMDVDRYLVASCRSLAGALRVCMSRSYLNRPDHWFADQIGLDPSHFSQCLKLNSRRPKHMPGEAMAKLMTVCGNRAPSQWLDMYANGELDMQREAKTKEQKLAELQAQIEELQKIA